MSGTSTKATASGLIGKEVHRVRPKILYEMKLLYQAQEAVLKVLCRVQDIVTLSTPRVPQLQLKKEFVLYKV